MESQTDICRAILSEFLDRWTIEKIKGMTLNQYVSVGDKDTFCQWLETKTRELGSIKGINSSKFGIYMRGDKTKRPKRLLNDNKYSWQRFYSETSSVDAFSNIQKELLKIIEYAENGQFEQIDNLHLTQFVRWKVAYLYSNERLIPIFKKDVLVKIARNFGLNADNYTPISEIQHVMISNKPSHLSIYEYSTYLYDKFGREKKISNKVRKKSRKPTRGSTKEKSTKSQNRKGSSNYIASQKHNILQEALKNKLIDKYGRENVFLEENFVDIKVTQPNEILFYEVKSAAYASDCIREALGQILSYTHRDDDIRPKHLIVAGQYEPNYDEKDFIKFIKKNLRLNFEYEHINLQ